MAHSGLLFGSRWAAASVVASLLLLVVAVASPRTTLLPFIAASGLIFVIGGLLMCLKANNERGYVDVARGLIKRFLVAFFATAICGLLAVATTDSLVTRNDQAEIQRTIS